MEEEGNAYVCLDTHTQELELKSCRYERRTTYEQGQAYTKSTMLNLCIEFAQKEGREQKGSYEYKTRHKPRSARNTGRKTGREETIHTRRRLIYYLFSSFWFFF